MRSKVGRVGVSSLEEELSSFAVLMELRIESSSSHCSSSDSEWPSEWLSMASYFASYLV